MKQLKIKILIVFRFSILVKNYLKYNVDISIEIQTAQSLKFPAVTVCNENPLRRSLIERINKFNDLVLLDDYVLSYVYSVAENSDSSLDFPDCADGYDTCNNTKVCSLEYLIYSVLPPSLLQYYLAYSLDSRFELIADQ